MVYVLQGYPYKHILYLKIKKYELHKGHPTLSISKRQLYMYFDYFVHLQVLVKSFIYNLWAMNTGTLSIQDKKYIVDHYIKMHSTLKNILSQTNSLFSIIMQYKDLVCGTLLQKYWSVYRHGKKVRFIHKMLW